MAGLYSLTRVKQEKGEKKVVMKVNKYSRIPFVIKCFLIIPALQDWREKKRQCKYRL